MGTPSDSELTQATGKVSVETISQRLSKMCNQSWVRAGEENVVVRCVCKSAVTEETCGRNGDGALRMGKDGIRATGRRAGATTPGIKGEGTRHEKATRGWAAEPGARVDKVSRGTPNLTFFALRPP
jgi:hypothetical protein